MPETKAYSHSQGLGFCGKVQPGQRLDGRGMRSGAQLTQSLRHRVRDTLTRQRVFLQRGVRSHEGRQDSISQHVCRQLSHAFCRHDGQDFDWMSGLELCPYPLKLDTLKCIFSGIICLFACNQAVVPNLFGLLALEAKVQHFGNIIIIWGPLQIQFGSPLRGPISALELIRFDQITLDIYPLGSSGTPQSLHSQIHGFLGI